MRSPFSRSKRSVCAENRVLLVIASLVWLGTVAACDSSVPSPEDDPADSTGTTAGLDAGTEDTQRGDGQVDSTSEPDSQEEVAEPSLAPGMSVTPTLASGTVTSAGFSTRFAITVPLTAEPTESESYRMNSAQVTFGSQPPEDQ